MKPEATMKKQTKPRKTPEPPDSVNGKAKKDDALAKPVNQTKPPRTGMEPV